MKLYTFQRMHVWETLIELGYYHPYDIFNLDNSLKEDLSYDWGFTHSYEWLREVMLEKNIQFTGANEHMIWAWYHWNGNKQIKPDKRFHSVYAYYENEPYVLLELDIDPARVLLSDYDLWHAVLNYWHAGRNREANQFCKQFNYYSKKPLTPEGDEGIKKSWYNIFDFPLSRKVLDIPRKRQQIQATFFELFYTDIVKVHFFSDKKCQKILDLHHELNVLSVEK